MGKGKGQISTFLFLHLVLEDLKNLSLLEIVTVSMVVYNMLRCIVTMLCHFGNSTSLASQKSERKEIEEVPSETNMNENISKSFELSNEDFPLLSSIGNRNSSASQQSEPHHNSSSPQMFLEFGTRSIPQPATEMSLGRKSQKEDSSATTPVVPSLAVETKGKCARVEEKTG
ncbi:hypothetical protein RYX36_007445 [Vicia faba]